MSRFVLLFRTLCGTNRLGMCLRMSVFFPSWPKRTLTLNCTVKLSIQVIKQSIWVSSIGKCPSFMPAHSKKKKSSGVEWNRANLWFKAFVWCPTHRSARATVRPDWEACKSATICNLPECVSLSQVQPHKRGISHINHKHLQTSLVHSCQLHRQ